MSLQGHTLITAELILNLALFFMLSCWSRYAHHLKVVEVLMRHCFLYQCISVNE